MHLIVVQYSAVEELSDKLRLNGSFCLGTWRFAFLENGDNWSSSEHIHILHLLCFTVVTN